MKNQLRSNQGFTLVELLITVAIIGILASQGVPAYKRMIQKSKKGEAQVMLSTVATAQSAFNAEYGTFGNNLTKMGAQMDGTNFIYVAQVDGAGCAKPALVPASITQFTGYSTFNEHDNQIGNIARTQCPTNAATTATTYKAQAMGSISAVSLTCPTSGCDVWSTDETRAIANTTDGIN